MDNKKRKKDLISVIVPVFNVEQFIDKCIKSILNQTYKNIEIILVNDGSTDLSGEICKRYARQYSQIKFIDKENNGPSAARNIGIQAAKGEFIGFVDSDDWIEPSMYEKLYNMMILQECDIVECAVNLVEDGSVKKYSSGNNYVLSGKDALKVQLLEESFNCIPRIAVWSRLYKYKFWENNRFPEGKLHEEYMLTCISLYEAKKFGIVNEGLYNHLVSNNKSITHQSFGKNTLFLEEQYFNRIKYLEEKGELELCEYAKNKYYSLLATLFYHCKINKMPESHKYLKLIKNNMIGIIHSKMFLKEKIRIICVYCFPSLYCKLQFIRQQRLHIKTN